LGEISCRIQSKVLSNDSLTPKGEGIDGIKMSDNMLMMQFASKFAELTRLIPDFIASEKIKMRRFDER